MLTKHFVTRCWALDGVHNITNADHGCPVARFRSGLCSRADPARELKLLPYPRVRWVKLQSAHVEQK